MIVDVSGVYRRRWEDTLVGRLYSRGIFRLEEEKIIQSEMFGWQNELVKQIGIFTTVDFPVHIYIIYFKVHTYFFNNSALKKKLFASLVAAIHAC